MVRLNLGQRSVLPGAAAPSSTQLAMQAIGKHQLTHVRKVSSAQQCPGRMPHSCSCRVGLPLAHPIICFPAKQLRGAVARRTAAGFGRRPFTCYAAKVTFEVVQETNWGESLRIIGGAPSLGDWNPDRAANMSWNDGHVWKATLEIPSDMPVEFKLIRAGEYDVIWEGGNNRKVQVPGNGSGMVVRLSWDKTDEALQAVKSSEAPGDVRPSGTPLGMSEEEDDGRSSNPQVPQELTQVLGSLESDRIETNKWQGRQIQFMRSNEHSRERQGRWDTSNLDGAALHLVQGDEKSPNWLGKLDTVKRVLVDDAPDKRPSTDALAHAYIYMQWIATGAIACVEGGGHYRPNHHAELAQVMFRSLEWVIADNSEASFVARKLQPKLPSFSDEFRASTPLTRIRDIAHRNDIPHELKQEIKHTLQNKLHRNAGPEDLVATEVMMERLIREAPQKGYPDAFLREFAVFLGELREFFSAGKLEDMLRQLSPSLDDAGVQVVESFLAAKTRMDKGDNSANTIMEVFHSVTTVRALLASGLSSGLRNDAPDSALLMRQRWRLAEGKCAEYSFTLMSRFINQLEDKGGAGFLSQAKDREWGLPLGAAVLGVRHMGLSGWDPSECMALENELAAWQRQGGFTKHDNALRLKATLERVQFLTQAYSDWELSIFSDRAVKLGVALGLPREQVMVFTEAEIRASVVFQLSKLATLLLKSLRLAVGAAAWDCIVSGEAIGKLVAVQSIDPATVPGPSEGPLVLLVQEANGDEEVGAVGPHLKGVILCQPLPHLSHLGVRARQERVPFVTCDDGELLDGVVRPLLNKVVRLEAGTEGVKLEETHATAAAVEPAYASSNGNGAAAVSGQVDKVTAPQVLPLSAAQTSTSGAKSASCAELARLEARAPQQTCFRTPAGCVLPFGSMDLAIQAAGVESQYKQLLDEIEKADLTTLDRLCGDLQDLLLRVRPDAATLRNIRSAFDGVSSVIVRSSSNVEDLAGMSGAGLYESIANVPVRDEEALGKAVAEVWASLYTRRAVLSRRTAGVPQGDASMAVLIMEMLAADISFVLHTVSPLDKNDNLLYAELAVGQGETLASGTKGSAWRLSVDKQSGAVTVHSFANFSRAFVPGGSPAGAMEQGGIAVAAKRGTMTVDYSKHALSNDASVREEIARRLTSVGGLLEAEFGGPQDVEGCFIGKDLYIVQTRPQP